MYGAHGVQKRPLLYLGLELQMPNNYLWVLGIEPGPLEEQPVLLTTQPSLQPLTVF